MSAVFFLKKLNFKKEILLMTVMKTRKIFLKTQVIMKKLTIW